MIKISTNVNEVFKNADPTIEIRQRADKLLRTIALDSVAMISERVQQGGKKSDGTKLQTKSKDVFGAYSIGHGKQREKKGRRTDQVDLTNSGDMMGDLTAEPSGEYEYIVGFRGEVSAQKAEYIEQYYGKVFEPTKEEEEFIWTQLEKGLDELFD